MSLLARGGSSLANLVMIPILLAHFGIEQYGAWVFILSLSSILAFMDLGVGNSLLNRGARLKAEERWDDIAQMVSTALWGFGAVGVALAAFLCLAQWGGFPVARACGLYGRASEAALLVFACQVVVAIPLAAIQRLQVGMGMGVMVPAATVVTTLSNLGLVIVGARIGMGLVPMVSLYAAVQFLVLAGSTAYFLKTQKLSVRISSFSPTLARELLAEGAPFLVLQVAATLVYYVDNLLVARFAGLESLAVYSIGVRAFQIVGMIPMMANTFIWPMYTVAIHRADMVEVRRLCKRMVAGVALWCGLMGLALFLAMPFLFRVWLHRPDLFVPPILGLGLLVWTTVEAVGNSVSTVLNAASKMKFQMMLAPITMVTVLGAKLLALSWTSIQWLPWATSFAYLASTLVPQWIHLSRSTSFITADEAAPASFTEFDGGIE